MTFQNAYRLYKYYMATNQTGRADDIAKYRPEIKERYAQEIAPPSKDRKK